MGTIRSKIFKGISGNIHIKVILKYKMLNLDNIVSNKKKKKDTTRSTAEPSSSERNDRPFKMLIIGPSGSGKTNTLLHLINNLHPIDKIYLCANDIGEDKYNI